MIPPPPPFDAWVLGWWWSSCLIATLLSLLCCTVSLPACRNFNGEVVCGPMLESSPCSVPPCWPPCLLCSVSQHLWTVSHCFASPQSRRKWTAALIISFALTFKRLRAAPPRWQVQSPAAPVLCVVSSEVETPFSSRERAKICTKLDHLEHS